MWWEGEEGCGCRWERSKWVKEFSLENSSCWQCVSRQTSLLQGEIHDTWMIELLKWDNCSFTPYSGSVM